MVHDCGVACAELAISIGLLDPGDPRSALIFVTAVEQDVRLISANIRPMDLLLQLYPTPNVLPDRPATPAETAAGRA
ncbi:MAG TPA: hypothetical protein VMU81_12750 [Acetobacteraceae bacterium]|jgi:hypothetical protein|nr:hypothetical protein [Acetobacteraceae bacterium]